MSQGTYVVEAELGSATGVYTDITAKVWHANYKRGRDYPSQLAGRSIAGSIELDLDNRDGSFNSFNSAGAYFGNLLPARKVRIRATAPVSATCQVGLIEHITPQPTHGQFAMAKLQALGPLAWLSQSIGTKVATKRNYLTSSGVNDVLDAAGWDSSTNGRQISTGQTTMTVWQTAKAGLTALRDLEASENGFLRETAAGQIAFDDRQYRLRTPYTVSQVTLRDALAGAGSATIQYTGITQDDPWQKLFNKLTANVQYYTSGAAAALWSAAAGQVDIDKDGSRTIWAHYPGPNSPTSGICVDTWTTPASNTDFTVNAATGGGGVDLTPYVSVTVNKYANDMQMIFSATASGFSAAKGYFTLLQARGVPLFQRDPIPVVQEDTATSQKRYGIRDYPNPGPFIPSIAEANDWAQWNLNNYKDPNPLITVTVLGNTDDNHLTQILTREIDDRVTLIATATDLFGANLGINEDFFIESIQGEITRYGEHKVTYGLSRASLSGGGFWVLGNTSFDVCKLGY